MSAPHVPNHCECLDSFHGGRRCLRKPADHGEVVASPALCPPCLFGCEDFNGTGRYQSEGAL